HLCGVLRLLGRLRDDERDGIADVAHLALRQHGMGRFLHRLPVRTGDQPAARQAIHARHVDTGVDRDDARRALRFARVDLADSGVGVRRAQEVRVGVMRWIDVVGVLSGPGEKAHVLLALHRLADEIHLVRTHGYLRMAAAPWATALTTFW